jgi:hypothetical protein
VLDTPGGIAGAEPDLRAPISSNCIATPFNADGDACQGGAQPDVFFLHLQAGTPKRLFASTLGPDAPAGGNGAPAGGNGAPAPAPGGNPGPGGRGAGPRMAIGRAALGMDRHGDVRVRLTCPAATATRCRGTLTLRARIAHRTRTIGTARFALRHGRHGLVRVHLARRAQRIVRSKHRLAAVASARATDAAGLTGTSTRSLLVRPAATHRR